MTPDWTASCLYPCVYAGILRPEVGFRDLGLGMGTAENAVPCREATMCSTSERCSFERRKGSFSQKGYKTKVQISPKKNNKTRKTRRQLEKSQKPLIKARWTDERLEKTLITGQKVTICLMEFGRRLQPKSDAFRVLFRFDSTNICEGVPDRHMF